MKTPRVHDFDPNAKLPELGSPMDHLPAIQKSPVKSVPPSPDTASTTALPEKNTIASGSPSARTSARTPVRRQLTRYAFEFYQDQVENLRHLSLEEKMQGGKGSMSEMVREAIDEYLIGKKGIEK